MKRVSEKLLNWASNFDEVTIEQAKQTSSMPFVYPHLALMPDAHLGKGSTVGSVVPTRGAIMPAAIGVDIGCGMMAVKTSIKKDQPFDKRALRQDIESRIPLSAGKQNQTIQDDAKSAITELSELAFLHESLPNEFLPDNYTKNWAYQLGTLGSGNHFIEITADEEGFVWLFLHSGSRGVGNKIAMHHIRVATQLCKKYFIELADPDLAYLAEDTDEFQQYIHEMNWAQRYAYLNRQVMMSRVMESFEEHTEDFRRLEKINCHHNFTQKENHWGQNLWITRKGAISANKGQMGLIPGSMGTASYVVEGLGNPLSFNSAPHGAGRQYARNQARKTFTMESLVEQMDGIEWNPSSAFLDEHPNAYKDIDSVMSDASDLVTIRHKLTQIINIKGD